MEKDPNIKLAIIEKSNTENNKKCLIEYFGTDFNTIIKSILKNNPDNTKLRKMKPAIIIIDSQDEKKFNVYEELKFGFEDKNTKKILCYINNLHDFCQLAINTHNSIPVIASSNGNYYDKKIKPETFVNYKQ